MDKWALSKLNTLVKYVDEGLQAYKITETARAIQAFVEELSNWYVRLSKSRFWGSEWTGDKKAAYETLYTVLTTLCKLAAPYVPFMTESMYRNLVVGNVAGAPESVHLCDYPVADESLIDAELEAEMEEVMDAVQLGRACRGTANIKVRQALSTLYVKGSKLSDACAALIRDELNVEEVKFIDDARAFTTYQIKPQLRTLGRRYGKKVPAIGEYLKTVDGNAFVDTLERDGVVKFEIDGTEIALEKDDCLIAPAQKPGFVSQTSYPSSRPCARRPASTWWTASPSPTAPAKPSPPSSPKTPGPSPLPPLPQPLPRATLPRAATPRSGTSTAKRPR